MVCLSREDARANGFCIVMDGNVIMDFMQVTMIKALNQFQVLYILSIHTNYCM